MRIESRRGPSRGRVARWVGRNLARLTYARRVEPTWLELNRHDIALADLPGAFTGFRIVQMSDFHGGKSVTPVYLEEAVALAQAQRGDITVLTGDFVHKGFSHIDQVARVLGRLRAPLGVFAVLGNHDFSVRNAMGMRRHRDLHRAVADALAAQGIQVLRNQTHCLERGQEHFYLTGVEDLWSRVCDLDLALSGLSPRLPRVVLAHNPYTVEFLAGRRCDLMLSGHTHGGQVKVPLLGRLALGPKGRRFAAGFYQVDKSLLYVNKGVGFGLRFRYGVRPEVAVFTLKPAHVPQARG
ncbi:MAG: metallophosphoesterase [Planctomycetes bacterium]|nr:metallophosphoesterase [Planctomycetota bacterium]